MRSILVGQISNVHGIKGEIKVYPYTDDIENFAKRKEFYIDENLNSIFKITRCRIQKNMLIVKLEGIDSVEDALKLKGKNIYIDKSTLEKLDKDTYYVDDLIDMEVICDDESIGKITYVFNTGANDIYEIKREDNTKIYLPAIHQVVKKVDINSKKMYVEIMEGLI